MKEKKNPQDKWCFNRGLSALGIYWQISVGAAQNEAVKSQSRPRQVICQDVTEWLASSSLGLTFPSKEYGK